MRLSTLLAFGVTAFAATSASAQDRVDVVILRDGTRVEGTVRRLEPGRFVVVRTVDGTERTLSWEKVDEVDTRAPAEAAATHAAAAAAGGEIRTTTEGKVDKSGASFTQTTDCTKDNGDPSCHREVAANASASGVKASYRSVSDCRENPNDPQCREETSASVGADAAGIGASIKHETVKRVHDPPNGAVNFGMDVGGGAIIGGPAEVGFLSGTMKIKFLVGGKFPREEGGGWSGLAFEPTLTGLVTFIKTPATQFSSGETQTAAGVQAGASAGWQILYFGKMDQSSLKQGGFGLLLGGFVGATGISAGGDMQFSPSYGPIINISFPSYNAGTANYSAFNLTGMVLPTGDAGTLVVASLGVFF